MGRKDRGVDLNYQLTRVCCSLEMCLFAFLVPMCILYYRKRIKILKHNCFVFCKYLAKMTGLSTAVKVQVNYLFET